MVCEFATELGLWKNCVVAEDVADARHKENNASRCVVEELEEAGYNCGGKHVRGRRVDVTGLDQRMGCIDERANLRGGTNIGVRVSEEIIGPHTRRTTAGLIVFRSASKFWNGR